MPHYCTYSPQDDKIRLYFDGRIDKELWYELKGKGFTWTMKQAEAGGCSMVATWTPWREDAALALCGEMEDEDQSAEERAAQRAERFAGYQEKREAEARELASRSGGIVANEDASRVDRLKAKAERIASKAETQWSKAEYWTRRTAGVIAHALHKDAPDVRHRRIKVLESEIRKQEKNRDEYVAWRNKWLQVAEMTDAEKQNEMARHLANYEPGIRQYTRDGDASGKARSLWSWMDKDRPESERISGAEAAAMYLAAHPEIGAEGRWLSHLRLRVAYEKQMLGEQGETAAQVEMAVGGSFAGAPILKVNKDADGNVSSLSVVVDGKERIVRKVERLGMHAYAVPTDESLAVIAAFKAKVKETKAKAPPLINPTDEEAEKLQAVFNAKNEDGKPGVVVRMTSDEMKEYNARHYAKVEVVELDNEGTAPYVVSGFNGIEAVCRIRVKPGSGYGQARSIVILTDSVQKPLPITWKADPDKAVRLKLRNADVFAIAQEARARGLVVANQYDTAALMTFICAHAVEHGG